MHSHRNPVLQSWKETEAKREEAVGQVTCSLGRHFLQGQQIACRFLHFLRHLRCTFVSMTGSPAHLAALGKTWLTSPALRIKGQLRAIGERRISWACLSKSTLGSLRH